MRNKLLIGIVFLGLLLGACAPASVRSLAPTQIPVVPTSLPIAAPQPTPFLSPEDTAWQKVEETAKKEGGLTIYSTHLYGDTGVNIRQSFMQRTGLKLDIVSAAAGALIERVSVERRSGQIVPSILTGAAANVQGLLQDGRTQGIGYLPELKDESVRLYDPWMDKRGHILSVNTITLSPWIHTDLVRLGLEPRSWKDLLKIEWQGKIGMSDPDIDAGVAYIYQALTSRGRLDDAYFKELGKQKIRFYPTVRMAAEALARREVPLNFVSYSSAANPFLKEGVPLKALDMAEGVVTYLGGGVIIWKDAPQPNAARVFINWLFSKEGQTVFHKYNGSSGFRKDVPSFEAPGAQFTPANPIMTDQEDQLKAEEIRKAKVVKKLLKGE